MKNTDLAIQLAAITILSIIINFEAFIFGGKAGIFGFLVSLSYAVMWVGLFGYALKKKRDQLIFASVVFWILTGMTALITLYANMNQIVDFSIMAPFALLFLTPLYGMNFLIDDTIPNLIVMIAFASCFIFSGIIFMLYNRQRKDPDTDRR